MKRPLSWAPCLALLAAAPELWGQIQERQFVEEEKRLRLDAEVYDLERGEEASFDFGAFVHSEFIHFDDEPFRDERTLGFHDLRIWGLADVNEEIRLFARVYNQLIHFRSGDGYKGDDTDSSVLKLDQGYVQADFRDVLFRAGRQFLTLGMGTVYNAVADGAYLELASGDFTFKGFAALSIRSDDDIDQSIREPDRSKRFFTGIEIEWRGIEKEEIYLLAMNQQDRNPEVPDDPLQDFEYQSTYLGVGVRGSVLGDTIHFLEAVYEGGESTAFGSTDREDIQAGSLRAGLTWMPRGAARPSFVVEYLFGSGDSDRRSPTSTLGGNAPGTDDEGFVPFGFVQTGYSLFPRLANLHILRAGLEIRPLPSVGLFERLDVGVMGYAYRKHRKDGGISDSRANLNDADVGTELDAHLRWRVLEDTDITVRYGVFFPGDAYPADADDRHFVSVGLTITY